MKARLINSKGEVVAEAEEIESSDRALGIHTWEWEGSVLSEPGKFSVEVGDD